MNKLYGSKIKIFRSILLIFSYIIINILMNDNLFAKDLNYEAEVWGNYSDGKGELHYSTFVKKASGARRSY